MKGRSLDGRQNIRALETLTGIDLIIDDTPEAAILSGFDPYVGSGGLPWAFDRWAHSSAASRKWWRRPQRGRCCYPRAGEQATRCDVHGLHPEIVKLLGRLKFRTSYGQNVLQHSIEVAHLAGIMASELRVGAFAAGRSVA